jgi:3-deoxy-manno-octulosonate cytidylyltransferase (CMP-KDO synthetase)
VIGDRQICGIIPARWGSTRFPGKILTPIAGRPLLEWIVRGCMRSQRVQRWIVATDDRRIAAVAERSGAEAVMTSSRFRCGSDRVAAVAKNLKLRWIVNWQGDEWLPNGQPIDRLVETLEAHPDCPVATLARPMTAAEAKNPHRVKVVVSRSGKALYFSRATIPHGLFGSTPALLHLGAYAFEKHSLLKFARLRQTPLEKFEKLEQLRLLENDVCVAVGRCGVHTSGIDTPADARRLTARINRMKK